MKSPVVDGLREIQKEHGYLPVEALQALANRIEVPLYRLQGVASFFPTFKLSTPPAVEVKICGDMSCHRRGADALRRAIEGRVGDRKDVVLGHASCLGQGDRAPAPPPR